MKVFHPGDRVECGLSVGVPGTVIGPSKTSFSVMSYEIQLDDGRKFAATSTSLYRLRPEVEERYLNRKEELTPDDLERLEIIKAQREAAQREREEKLQLKDAAKKQKAKAEKRTAEEKYQETQRKAHARVYGLRSLEGGEKMSTNYDREIAMEIERQRRERIREGWKEFYENNPDFGKSKMPDVFSKLPLDKLDKSGDKK